MFCGSDEGEASGMSADEVVQILEACGTLHVEKLTKQ
jgi:hypothetical protein